MTKGPSTFILNDDLTFHCCLWEYNLCYLICEIEKLSGLRDSFVKIRGQWCKPQSITISYTRLHPTYTLTQTGNFTTTSLQHTSHGSCSCVLGNTSFNANYSFKPSCSVDKIQQAYQSILRTVVVRQRDDRVCACSGLSEIQKRLLYKNYWFYGTGDATCTVAWKLRPH
jgi:hypothetical protein